MNRKQWLVLVSGTIFTVANLLFPRAYHGSQYLFYTTTKWYEVQEMTARVLTLLVIVLVAVLLLREGKKALNRRQKGLLLGGLGLWLFLFLFPPDPYLPRFFTTTGYYFRHNWDSRLIDYHFTTDLLVCLFVLVATLVPLLGYRLNPRHWMNIVLAFSLLPLGQFYYLSGAFREEHPYFGLTLFLISTMATAAWLALMNIFILQNQRRQGQHPGSPSNTV